MTEAQLHAMQAGRKRALEARAKEAQARVTAFRRWLANGSVTREIPEVPTDADYAAAA